MSYLKNVSDALKACRPDDTHRILQEATTAINVQLQAIIDGLAPEDYPLLAIILKLAAAQTAATLPPEAAGLIRVLEPMFQGVTHVIPAEEARDG